MIRVAHLISSMSVGGLEQMVLTLCKFRNRSEFDYIVVAPNEGIIADEIRKTGTPVYTGWAYYHLALRSADIVNLHWCSYHPDWHALLQRSGKPYVTTLHSAAEMPNLSAVTICTARHTYEIQKYKSQCIIISNGVDLSRFVPRPKPQREEVVITRVCRPSRCALYFWTAMEKVLSRYPQTRLWIVGNEDNLGQSSEQVRFWGIRRDIPEILAKTDIFAYTPYPNTGTKDLVVMEASAMGVPCVVSDVDAVRESVEHGQNGFLTPFGDADAFAEKVGILVQDTSLRAQMSQTAIHIAQKQFDMRRVTQYYEAVYRAVLETYPGNPELAVKLVKTHKAKLILDVRPYALMTYPRLAKMYEITTHLEREKIDGSFVECGVCNGGSAGIIAKVAEHNPNRHTWLFDSWEGLPEPTEDDITFTGIVGQKGIALGSEERVKELIFKKLELNNNKVHLVKGWFNDTIPLRKKKIGKIALLHLDCDWYESVKFCLEELYDSVVKGGFIVIDDYGYWKGCKKAVDEFVEARNLKIELVRIDVSVYFQK